MFALVWRKLVGTISFPERCQIVAWQASGLRSPPSLGPELSCRFERSETRAIRMKTEEAPSKGLTAVAQLLDSFAHHQHVGTARVEAECAAGLLMAKDVGR